MEFAYQALDGTTGAPRRGVITAGTQAEALGQLESQGMVPLSVRERRAGIKLLAPKAKLPQVADMMRNLADLLGTGGVPLLQALSSIQQEEPSPALREVLGDLTRAITEGRSFGQALAAHPKVFPDVVVAIIATSEARGDLPHALNEAARLLERSVSTLGRIRSAMMYPAFVILVAVGVVVFMSVSVLPQMADIFRQADTPLPLPTLMLMAFGTLLTQFWYAAVLLAVGAVAGVRYALTRPDVRRQLDILAWNLPGVKLFTRNFAYSRWCSTVGIMHTTGVALLETLSLARNVTGNTVMVDALASVGDRIRDGLPLSTALRGTGVFPPTLIQQIALGEEHGTLGDALIRTGKRYEVTTERLLEKLPQIMEPAFIVVIGVIIGGMLLALYWPLISIYQAAAR